MKKISRRTAGILMAVSSLPSRHGCGTFGASAYRFVDYCAEAGFHLWQLLPLNPLGYGNSPYQPYSSMAFDDIYLDLDILIEEGLLKEAPSFREDAEKVDFQASSAYRLPYLKEAFRNAKEKGFKPERFLKKNPWAKVWGYFMLNKRRYPTSWDAWPKEVKEWINGPHRIKKEDLEDFEFEIWLQEELLKQFSALRAYCHKKGVLLMGDLPFYSGFDSADVYGNQDQFRLHKINRKPTVVAGVPPDYFSPTGQRWGNPIYDWKKLKQENYSYLIDRIAFTSRMYDLVRLDHFRAFDTYYVIPAYCPTAMVGKWVVAPGKKFFKT
ncbi:MAG: 4-alpha-glucanotransferase, partial [Bacilli bacterium]|nr:4-alpha-glucanotransferase [Bacilli bacterium]